MRGNNEIPRNTRAIPLNWDFDKYPLVTRDPGGLVDENELMPIKMFKPGDKRDFVVVTKTLLLTQDPQRGEMARRDSDPTIIVGKLRLRGRKTTPIGLELALYGARRMFGLPRDVWNLIAAQFWAPELIVSPTIEILGYSHGRETIADNWESYDISHRRPARTDHWLMQKVLPFDDTNIATFPVNVLLDRLVFDTRLIQWFEPGKCFCLRTYRPRPFAFLTKPRERKMIRVPCNQQPEPRRITDVHTAGVTLVVPEGVDLHNYVDPPHHFVDIQMGMGMEVRHKVYE